MYVPQGVSYVVDILNKSTKYMVYYDPDPDGLVAGSFVTKLLTDFGKESSYYINENREHGFMIPLNTLEKYRGYTIIAVDFSISNELLKQIVDLGLNIINIDHHETLNKTLFTYSNNNYSAILINNQYEFEPLEQRFQSGAGMVYYTFASLFPDYMINHQNEALVGLTLISDVRELENESASYFLSKLYSWKGSYTNYLIELAQGERQYNFGVQKVLDRNFLDYSLLPKFNALFRLNMGDIAIKLFNRVPYSIDLSEVRYRQQIIVDNLMKSLTDMSLDNLTMMSVDISGFENNDYKITNFIGLVCGRIKDMNEKTAFLFVKDKDKVVRGSVRGVYDNVDYLAIFRKYGVNCAGHKGAFGVREFVITDVDFEALSNEIYEYELKEKELEKNDKRYIKVSNLKIATLNETNIPTYNIYVRDNKRMLYDCSDCNYRKTYESASKDYVQYSIDGISVKCFDKTLTPKNGGYVMPMLVNGYIEYYLRRV